MQKGEAMKSSAIFGNAVTPKASPALTGRVPETLRDVNSEVKLIRCDAVKWLFAELGYNDETFGPCDLRCDCSELRHDGAQRVAS